MAADMFFADTVDDTASTDDMTGDASYVNQASAKGLAKGTPTRALVMLWAGAVLLYWVFAYLFKRQLS